MTINRRPRIAWLTEAVLCLVFIALVGGSAARAACPPPPALQLGPQLLCDDFSSLNFDTPADLSPTWSPDYSGFASLSARFLASNHESQAYVYPGFKGVFLGDNAGALVGPALDANGWPTTLPYGRPGSSTNPPAWIQQGKTDLGLNPFSRSPTGGLRITNSVTPAALAPYLWNRPRISGQLVSKPSLGNPGFSFLYGFIEAEERIDGGDGIWPQSPWLIKAGGTWPPELDVFEGLGNDTSTAYQTAHSNTYLPLPGWRQVASRVTDWSRAFVRVGALWTPTDIVYFVNGVETGRIKTPVDMNTPMFILLSLGSGGQGSWGGSVDATTPAAVNMDLNFVRVYALDPNFVLPPGPMNINSAPPPPPPVTGSATYSLTLSNGEIIDFHVDATRR